jgi:hypothetical protein
VSAPSNLAYASYYRNPALVHTRAHTADRPLSLPRSDMGYAIPYEDIYHGGHHARTHSTPPDGRISSNRRMVNTQRPVLTGDALSRLAKTIGGATVPPAKAAIISAGHD